MNPYHGQVWKERLNNEIITLVKDPVLKHGNVGICVLNAETGKTLYEYNSQKMMTPASTLKTLTTGAALGILGKNYRYETKIFTTGELNQNTGVLNGNILVEGSGDPSLGSEYFEKNKDTITNVEREIFKALSEKGIKKILGKILINNSCFDNQVPDDWIWSDLGNYYGAPPNGLSFRDNKFYAYFSSAETGKKTILRKIKPDLLELDFVNEVFSEKDGEELVIFRGENEGQRIAKGTIPPNQKNYEAEGSIPNPEIFFKNCLADYFEKKGIIIENNILDTSSGKNLIFTYYSPELEKIVYWCNLKSNNHYAETILRTIDYYKTGKGTLTGGIKYIKEFWKAQGVDVDGLVMNDGSGLSRSNCITPQIEAQVLHKIYTNPGIYNCFSASLPVAGKSGTLTGLGKGTCLEGNLKAKSGYIKRVRSYCGYLKTKGGESICFSIICNNFICKPSEMKKKIEGVLEEFCK